MRDRSVVVQAVGDIALGDHPLCVGFGTHSRLRRQEPRHAFEHVEAVFARADILFGNLECTLSERGLRPHDYRSIQMRGHLAYAEGLRDTGFAVLNVANNHSMQHGVEPFLETVDALRRCGIHVCGVAGATHRTANPVVVERNGLRVTFLGYSLRPRQYFTREPLYAEGSPEQMLEDVRFARATSEAVVVSLHWGDEFIHRPAPREIALARALVDEGANLVIGHHPHVLRGGESYRGGCILYSLGNFVCDMLWDEALRESAIAQCRLTPGGVSELQLIPLRIEDDCRPVPLRGDRAAVLRRRMERLSEAIRREPADADTSVYAAEADGAQRDQRRKAHRYFVRHVHRLPPGIIVQQVARWARNRLVERGLLSERG
jgi:poly-gamma-glutamate synthesis protein (capsule biosynthesis protein)